MSDVLLALGTALAGGFASGWPAYLRGRSRGRAESQDEGVKSNRTLAEELSGRFGWKASEIVSIWEATEDGDSTTRRQWKGIEAATGCTVSQFPGRFWVSSPGGKILGAPELRLPDGYAKGVRLQAASVNQQESRYHVEVLGGITYGEDPPLGFEVVQEMEKSALIGKRAVEEAFKNDTFQYDYHAFDVPVPTGKLRLEVSFPRGTAVRLHPFVFFGWSECEHQLELKRIQRLGQSGFSTGSTWAKLEVPDPVVGLRYAIYWDWEK